MIDSKTIVALSSPMGVSAIAVIRVSGSESSAVLDKHFGLSSLIDFRMVVSEFKDEKGKFLDKLMLVKYPKGKSYTGELMLEIFPHGNPLIIRKIIEALISNPDVRLAGPGEFTRRRFENGKIDLIEAEGVAQVIHAKSLAGIENARKIIKGRLSAELGEIRRKLIKISSRLELDMDFSEEELEPDYSIWKKDIGFIFKKLSNLKNSWSIGKSYSIEPKVTIAGRPNAGKSSLINSILQSDRLLVSEVPGTTRDYVEVQVQLKGGSAVLIDTAGIGKTDDFLDSQSQEKTTQILSQSDKTVLVIDGTQNLPGIYYQKTWDLVISTRKDKAGHKKYKDILSVSNKTGEGIEEVINLLSSLLFDSDTYSEPVNLATQRQYYSVSKALGYLQNALKNMDFLPAPEVVAFEINQAKQCLQELVGEVSEEDVINQIFSEFCVGK